MSRITIRQDAAAIDVGWLDFYTDATGNTCINEALQFTAIATI